MANQINPDQQFEALTFEYLDQLFRVAFARVGNAQDAEDIVQETYLKGYRSFSTLRRDSSIKNWLTKILLNNVRDYFRSASRRIQTVDISEIVGEEAAEPSETGPEERLCEREIDPKLWDALASMPAICLTPLLLREIYDASYSDIAATLNIPIGTVMSRLSRARASLRKQLQSDEHSGSLSIFPNVQNERKDLGDSLDAVQ